MPPEQSANNVIVPSSPFKFLDAYSKDDIDIFFGRDKETDKLYHALSGVKHLLVYGPSGAGKTSLIECGLRNQFSDADWFALTIRKGDNMTASVFNAINDALENKLDLDTTDTEQHTFEYAVQCLFEECYQPIYLLFDQFEELLISGSEEEQRTFFKNLNELISHRVPCRILLIMREEFVGHLSEFEHLCPTIFQNRFRLEKIRIADVKEVILQTLTATQFNNSFKVENPKELTKTILSKLPDNRKEIELTHVQVFLSELWDRAFAKSSESELPVLKSSLVNKNDNLERILDSFLRKQLQAMDKAYGEKIPLEILVCMISERHTKLQITINKLQSDLVTKNISFSKTDLKTAVNDFINRKILREIKINNETHYEISHDILALVIGKSLTEEMQLREKARDIYAIYEEKKGFFSQEDLDYLRPFEVYLPFSDVLQKRIEASEVELENKLKAAEEQVVREKSLRRGVSYVALFAAMVALVAGWFYFESDKANKLAKSNLFLAAVMNEKHAFTKLLIKDFNNNSLEIKYSEIKKLSFERWNINKLFDEIMECKYLEKINLSHNQLIDISSLRKLSNLKSVNLSHNKITDSDILKKLPSITDLNLSNNRIWLPT